MLQEFTKTIRLDASPELVWNAVLDVHRVASWLSIVREVRDVEPPRRYAALLEDRLGPFAMRADRRYRSRASEGISPNRARPGSGVLSLRASTVLPSVRAVETSPPRHPSAAVKSDPALSPRSVTPRAASAASSIA